MKPIFLLSLCVGLMSCSHSCTFSSYNDARRYSTGNAETRIPVSRIDIEWKKGDIEILLGDDNALFWYEKVVSGSTTGATQLHYLISDGELKIRYGEAGLHMQDRNLQKDLVLVLPHESVFHELEVESTCGNLTADIRADKVTIESKGNVMLHNLSQDR